MKAAQLSKIFFTSFIMGDRYITQTEGMQILNFEVEIEQRISRADE
ncbi:MAG TPA: hypothetical protein V6C57_01910 [Coleofasciculaceae cyanobacterium]